MNLLFICWDGAKSTYLESLFIPIYLRLKKVGINISVLQFSWDAPERVNVLKKYCEEKEVDFHHIPVLKKYRLFGALYSIVVGYFKIRKLINEDKIDYLFPRSTIPAFISLFINKFNDCEIIYDADGLPLDERVEFSGLSNTSFRYRFLRDVEMQIINKAKLVLTRSKKASDVLIARAGSSIDESKFHVVLNGRDISSFNILKDEEIKEIKDELGFDSNCFLIVYVGSLGGKYYTTEILKVFKTFYQNNNKSRLLVITPAQELITKEFTHYPELELLSKVITLESHMVGKYLGSGDLGLALIKPTYSMKAVSPIKQGEYLLCGLPFIACDGVGDTDFIDEHRVGYLIDSAENSDLDKLTLKILTDLADEDLNMREFRRSIGLQYYSLDASVNSYFKAFNFLISNVITPETTTKV